MEYRTSSKISEKISLLGFGCMRFPLMPNGKIDRVRSTQMLKYAHENGVNYFDTAYPYHGGESEEFLGEFLKSLDRSTYYLATKLPCWAVNTLEDAKRIFNEQRKKLCVEYFDFYLLHALNKSKWEKMTELGVVNLLEDYVKKGYIKHLGFSFHDSYDVFEQIITARDWDFCQLQINYMDMNVQAGLKGYELAKSRGTAVIVMEPVKGGSLANVPDNIGEMFRKINPNDSPASWALRYTATFDNVLTVLSGMSAEEQVEDNVKTFAEFRPLDEVEQATVIKAREIFLSRVKNGCTGCRYCMPCPQKVNITGCFSLWNKYGMFGNSEYVKNTWKNEFDDEEKPSACVKCDLCVSKCPQNINIIEDLQKLTDEFDSL